MAQPLVCQPSHCHRWIAPHRRVWLVGILIVSIGIGVFLMDYCYKRDIVGVSRLKKKKRPSLTVRNITVVPPEKKGYVNANSALCRELLNRTNETGMPTIEGEEPWRNQEELVFFTPNCGNQGESILGNHLSRWYVTRIIAAAAGVTINYLGQCKGSVTEEIQQVVAPPDTVIDTYPEEIAPPFSWRSLCTNGGRPLVYPHADGPLQYAVSTIQSDLRQMAHRVIKDREIDLDEVTLHLRTGDVFVQKHGLYGLVPYESYATLIPSDAQSIGIITPPFSQKRSAWGHGDADLNQAVVVATRDYLQAKFPKARVTIRNNETEPMDVVYARLILAPKRTICGPSTFCLFPALAAVGESYIFHTPLFHGKDSWLNNVDQAFPDIHYVDQYFVPCSKITSLNVSDVLGLLEGTGP